MDHQHGNPAQNAATQAAGYAAAFQDVAHSQDGQMVKQMLGQEADTLRQAVKTGDLGTLKNAFDNLMQTEAGARLIHEMRNRMKK